MTSRFASLTERVIEKIVEDKDTQNTKRSTMVAEEQFEREKTERTCGKERVDTNFENIHFMSKRERNNSFNV